VQGDRPTWWPVHRNSLWLQALAGFIGLIAYRSRATLIIRTMPDAQPDEDFRNSSDSGDGDMAF